MIAQERINNGISAIFLTPDYKIYSLLKDNENYRCYVCDLNDFIANQETINAPGKDLRNPELWFSCKIRLYRIEWDNGVALSNEYIIKKQGDRCLLVRGIKFAERCKNPLKK